MFIGVGVSVLFAAGRLLLGVSGTTEKLQQRVSAAIRRWKLDDADTVAPAALLLSVGALAVAVWYFLPLLQALTASVPDLTGAPADQLAMLSPALTMLHRAYRKAFVEVTVVAVLAWYPVLRLASKRGQPVNRPLLMVGAGTVFLAITLLDFPYRLLTENDVFPIANWQGARCYVLGERGSDVLLFCPKLTPRKRLLLGGSRDIERLPDSPESPFSEFQLK